jgi:hypothetical protein
VTSGPVLYLHPGLPKTASSFLEARVFRHLKESGWSFNDDRVVAAARGVCFPEQSVAGPGLAERVRQTGCANVLLSYDAMCGDPYRSFADREAVLERLRAACGGLQVRVLLVVRRQAEWIESLYRQSLHEYYFTPFPKFVVWPDSPSGKAPYPSLAVRELSWSEIAEGFASAFGRESVTVLPYELLVQRPEDFIARLGRFFGVAIPMPEAAERVNRGYGALSCAIAVRVNPFLREKSRFGFLPNRPFYYALKEKRGRRPWGLLFRWSSKLSLRYFLQQYVDRFFWSPPRLLTVADKQRVTAVCAADNRRLASFTDADLAALGYTG